MIFHMRCSAPYLAAAALVLGFVLTRIASAQDVMELDLAFKNGTRGNQSQNVQRSSPQNEQKSYVAPQRRQAHDAQGQTEQEKRRSDR